MEKLLCRCYYVIVLIVSESIRKSMLDPRMLHDANVNLQSNSPQPIDIRLGDFAAPEDQRL